MFSSGYNTLLNSIPNAVQITSHSFAFVDRAQFMPDFIPSSAIRQSPNLLQSVIEKLDLVLLKNASNISKAFLS